MLKVYITDLAAYNCGYLIGEWITLPLEENELKKSIKKILQQGQEVCEDEYHEEYFITDFEFMDVKLFEVEEYSSPYELNRQLTLIQEQVEPHQYKSVKVLLENGLVSSLEEAIEKIDGFIIYEKCSMTDIAIQYIEEYTDLNGYHPLITAHIDYEGIGRDLELDGSYFREGVDIFQFIG